MTLREQIVAAALRWEHTPFHDLAHVRGVGCDCGGLIIGVAKEVGLLAPSWRCPPYAPQRHLHQDTDLMSGILAACGCTSVAWETRLPGDVLTFRVGRTVSHAGFLLPDGDILHALIDQGVRRQPLGESWVGLHDRVWTFPYVGVL